MPPTLRVTRSSTPAGQQKRVLPSRLRRGGPGIGTCDTDVMILDTCKRKSENQPLIPASTPFLLTTNSALVASMSESPAALRVNAKANMRYFDRPEVLKAYKEQLQIETPDFVLRSEDATVGGRFRPREPEDQEADDTSDAVYEKRHRKYETFEKRLRVREREKLKHEHYKLKQRIEQLRAMDVAAFLALPSSNFSSAPESDETAADASTSESHNNEGERRKQEMLEVALELEHRYRTLLPHDRKAGNEREGPSAAPTRSSELADDGDGEFEVDEDEQAENEVEEDTDVEPPKKKVPRKLKLNIRFPPRRTSLTKATYKKRILNGHTASLAAASPTMTRRPRLARAALQEAAKNGQGIPGWPGKRKRRSAMFDHLMDGYIIPPSPAKPTVDPDGRTGCVLLHSALRNAGSPQTRKTQRNVIAFGTKVPAELEEVMDYSLPSWIMNRDAEEDNGEEEDAVKASLFERAELLD